MIRAPLTIPLSLSILVLLPSPGALAPPEALARSPQQPRPINLPCRLTAKPSNKVKLSLWNPSRKTVRVLFGAGQPSSRVLKVRGKRFIIAAGYTCRLDYLHRCWHATEVVLRGRKWRSVVIDKPSSAALSRALKRGAVRCQYRAMRAPRPSRGK